MAVLFVGSFAVLRMTLNSRKNHGEAVYIINFAEIAYHQNEVLYIIKPQIDAR